MITTTERVRALNDQLRTSLQGGTVMLTRGIVALGPQKEAAILDAVRRFDTFTSANDSYEEHDLGLLEVGGERVMFKIDYYDRSMCLHSPDPSDPKVTTRVLTIMLADEY